MQHRILILGASYGSLLATKFLMSGHRVTLVCTRDTADLIKREGTVVRFPLRGREAPVAITSRELPGALSAGVPEEIDPAGFQLVVLGMQEFQYGLPGVRELMDRVARARVPSLAIMNMPPLPFLKRIPGLSIEALAGCYADPAVWDGFEPGLVTLASPDPQAFRPAGQPKNVLEVGLPSNFKVAPFEDEAANALLRDLEDGIALARYRVDGAPVDIPVKLKVHDSIFVPLAKWPMLIAGNYRCIRPNGMIPIREAVHGNLAKSREIYDWVVALCCRLGARPSDLVPFDKYARAAEILAKPSSAARTLFGGAEHIERVDQLVRRIARQLGLYSDALQEIVTLVDERLGSNRPSRLIASP